MRYQELISDELRPLPRWVRLAVCDVRINDGQEALLATAFKEEFWLTLLALTIQTGYAFPFQKSVGDILQLR